MTNELSEAWIREIQKMAKQNGDVDYDPYAEIKLGREICYKDKDYYKKLKEFHEKHKNATCIVVCEKTQMPIKAEYHFECYEVAKDWARARLAITAAMMEKAEADIEEES